ncbi:protein MAINTENANCE OF MERISTEMS-like [Papaver somniferum]|uniref:protein MAINTENANCE OF MERISTEMS-like n=1 Tax=Papaver somniferum TaxID=3469 RepID=UPI000E6F9226|nr:protein MAINTENANCE OF MERISTEMS-like [Papaver somniferum]
MTDVMGLQRKLGRRRLRYNRSQGCRSSYEARNIGEYDASRQCKNQEGDASRKCKAEDIPSPEAEANFMGTKKFRAERKEVTREHIIATTNAYVLYVLGAVIFSNVSGARVSANFIQLLQPFDKIHEYSWGNDILAHSLNELRKASKAQMNQMGGNMDFLHAWIYVHFPIFSQRAFENKEWNHEYYGDKYTYKSKPKKKRTDYLNLRSQLDNLTTKDVIFDPYKKDLAEGKGKRKKEERAFHRYPLGGPSQIDDEAIPDYMPWYLNVSHTRVIRVDERPKIEDKDTTLEFLAAPPHSSTVSVAVQLLELEMGFTLPVHGFKG